MYDLDHVVQVLPANLTGVLMRTVKIACALYGVYRTLGSLAERTAVSTVRYEDHLSNIQR